MPPHAPAAARIRELLLYGTPEPMRAFLKGCEPSDLAELVRTVPEADLRRALGTLELAEQYELIGRVAPAVAADVLEALAPPRSADLLERAGEDLRNRLFALMELEDQAEVLREIDQDDAREDLIESIPDADLADIAEQQLSDDAADLVEELPETRRERVLDEMEAGKRAEIEQLAQYPRDTAGGLMQTELVRLRETETVAEATEHVRRGAERVGGILDAYVVDEDGRLVGSVRGRDLLLNPAHVVVGACMRRDPKAVPLDMDQERIAEIVQDYDLASVPVVDGDGRLEGSISVDDILDVLEEEATEDVARMAGTAPIDVYSQSIVNTVRARFPWLMATFGGGLLTVLLILTWEEALVAEIPLLAAVIPIIMGMSGNVGTQAATVTVRGIAVGEIDFSRLGRVVAKEMATGLAFAACFGALLYPLIRFVIAPLTGATWPAGVSPAMVVLVPAVAMALTIAASSMTGTLVPLILHKLGKDPAVASAPFITTAVDVLAIALLLGAKLTIL